MRSRSRAQVLGIAVLLLLSGCAPAPQPIESPSAAAPESASPTPTPSPRPAVEPTAAFDVTCGDVAVAIEADVGAPATPMQPVMSTVSTMNWIPGPAQYMFQRAGGIACSAGDESGYWEVTIVPGAQAVIDGAEERGQPTVPGGGCENDYCRFEITDGDVHLSAFVYDPDAVADEASQLEAAFTPLVSAAASRVREVEHGDSGIVGARCERFMRTEELTRLLGTEVREFTDFGGWGIPAEVYHVVNGASHCLYTSPGSGYEVQSHLEITMLPAGAWAFERQEGTPVIVDGADAATTSTGSYGRTFLDLRIGPDWIRLTTFDDGSGAPDPLPIAELVVRNFTVGHLAPQ